MIAEQAAETIDLDATELRTLHLCAFVERTLAEVWARFGDPSIDDLLQQSMQAALRRGGDDNISAHVSRPIRDSRFKGHVAVQWHGPGASGPSNEGMAQISLAVVQSGHDPITELHVALTVDAALAPSIARNTRRFLEELTARLERLEPLPA